MLRKQTDGPKPTQKSIARKITDFCLIATAILSLASVAMIRQAYNAVEARALPAGKDIVGNTAIRVEVDGEEHLLVCNYAKVFVSVYNEFDVAHDEQYKWVDSADDYPVVMGDYSARLDNNLFITVVKYYEDQNKPSFTVGKTIIMDYDYSLSYPYDFANDIKKASVITIQ